MKSQDIEEYRQSLPEYIAEDWYVIAGTSCAAINEPALLVQVFKAALDGNSDPKKVLRRLREGLVKILTLVGVPRILRAIPALVKCVKELGVEKFGDESFAREHAALSPDNRERGLDMLKMIYQERFQQISDFLANQAMDFDFIMYEILYGLILSEASILDLKITELIVATTLTSSGMIPEAEQHILGCQRVGISKEDVTKVIEATKKLIASA